MSTVQELIKEKQQRQLKTEISYIKAAVIGTMSYLDMADDSGTAELYSKLDNVLLEIIRLESKPEYNSSVY
jgi:hypothetical protein